MKKAKWSWWSLVPVVPVVLMAGWVVASLFPRQEATFHVLEFGRLPVLMNGRVQPFDSVARNSLLQIRGKQTAPVRLHFSVFNPRLRGQVMPAMEWLLELMARPEAADTRKVFRVDHPELVALLKLPQADPDRGEDGKHFSFEQLRPALDELEKQARRASEKASATRTPFEQQTVKVFNAVMLYHRLKHTLTVPQVHDLAAEVAAYEKAIGPGMVALNAREAGQDYAQEDFNRLMGFLQRYEFISRTALPMVVPPEDPAASARDDWANMGTALMASARAGRLHPAIAHFGAMASAFHENQPEAFNRALTAYRGWLGQHFVDEHQKTRAEVLFNYLEPFYKALVIYLVAFLLICAYWIRNRDSLRQAGTLLVWLGLGVHTLGLVYRMVLEGRPPVTNLYSSAVFIGWGSAVLGVILERIYRVGLGASAGSFIGFLTLIVAHHLSKGGDTMEMMRAVLDSNFWLGTHVVTITIGYSANFLAGFLGILLLVLGVMSRVMTRDMAVVLERLIYGIICFATLFSFVGTILGGIWADQSWGRFWGWDPKENGALIIVLWNAVILHARWAEMVRERGMACLAIFGNIVTSFSWFGVNMLGVGLHSYGFMDSAFKYLALFIASQVALMALAAVPTSRWPGLRTGATGKAGEAARAGVG